MNQKPLHFVVGVSCGFYWVIEVGRWIWCFVGVEIRIVCLADIVDYFLWNVECECIHSYCGCTRYTAPTYRVPMGTLYPPMDPAQQVACVGDRWTWKWKFLAPELASTTGRPKSIVSSALMMKRMAMVVFVVVIMLTIVRSWARIASRIGTPSKLATKKTSVPTG